MKMGWQEKKLGEVCQIVNGGTPDTKVPGYWGSENLWITPKDMGKFNGIYVNDTQRKITDDGLKNSSAKLLPINSVILSTRAPIGHLVINQKEMSTNQGCKGIIPSKSLTTEFVYYFLKNSVQLLNNLGSGAIFKELSGSKLASVSIKFPSLSEQQRIVQLIEEALEVIDMAKDNAEKNLQNAREVFTSYVQNIFNNTDEDWEYKTLGDKDVLEIIDGDRGKNYPKKNDFFDSEYCLFMNTKNVRPDGFDFETTMFITEKKDNLMGKGKLNRNDVVMTTRGTIGNLGVYSDDVEYNNVRINSGMLIFRPNLNVITSEYLFEILRSGIIKIQIKEHASGAAQPQLPIKTLVNFAFPIPKSIEKQKDIVDKLTELSEKTKQLEAIYQQKLTSLEELKKSILKKAFDGEL